MYFLYSLLSFIIFNIISLFFLLYKDKFNKTALLLGAISIVFAIFHIILLNISYNNEISESSYKVDWFFKVVRELNTTFGIVSIIITFMLFILSFKIRYYVFHAITIATLTVTLSILFLHKGLIITKTNIDLSTLSVCLMNYYLNFATMPLLFKKHREHIQQK